ncbi:MAG: reprolysin-like metallopeptidase [Cellvibrionaceae bacterium]
MKLSIRALVLLILSSVAVAAKATALWQDTDSFALRNDLPLMAKATNARHIMADIEMIRSRLLGSDNLDFEIPLPNGQTAIYHLEYSPIAEQGLLDKFPEIRTFRGVDVTNPENRGRFDISPAGFRGMFHHNGEVLFIDPQYLNDSQHYISYSEKNAQPVSGRPDDQIELPGVIRPSAFAGRVLAKGGSDGNLRTYRLAVAVTGEYTDFFSDEADPVATKRTLALAAITTAVNRVNEIFERDLGITFNLVANNDQIIYVDATTDTYANDSSISDLSRNQINIDTVIGAANYDIGHLFGTGEGGVAALGSVCDNPIKARGLTGLPSPTGDSFYIDFVSHEIGHQFGANHTFNGTTGSCGGANRNQTTAYEPGSGSTIMAYVGICGAEDLPDQANSDAFFHAGSIAEITRYVTTGDVSIGGSLVSGEGDTCGTITTPVNNEPDAMAFADVTVPANTPLYLEGAGTDADVGDTLTYVWEQLDAGTASASVEEWVDDGSRAIFRSFLPTTTDFRYLPNLSDLIDNDLDNGESIPTTNRNLNFRFTVRDGSGATAFENKVVTVTNSAGPFDLLTPEDDDVWTQGTTVVTWDVANTDVSPVNCANVDIYYDGSISEGMDVTTSSFATTLALAVPNDGSQLVTTPATATINARVMIRCSDNAFFTMSSEAFEVSASTSPIVSGVSDGAASEGNPITFSVVMSAVPAVDETVNFELIGSSAASSDFGEVTFSSGVVNNNDGTLTVPAGIVTFSAVVPTTEDSSAESDETFILSVGSASGTGTINDDDTDSSGGDSTSCSSTPGCEEGSSGGSSGMIMLVFMSLLLVSARRRRLL